MKHGILTLLCLIMAVAAWSQTARLQVIHNSPSPTVDIWVNGQPFLTNFAYRTATSFVDVPAGTTLNIGVAPSPSDSPDDIIATFPVTLAPDQAYIAIATGIVGNATTPFNLVLVEDAREAADAGEVDFLVYHGSTDAPAVDVIARGVGTLVDNAAYGDVTDYLTVPAAAYTLDVTPAMDNDQIVASFAADLSGLGGGAAVVFASGFLAPPTAADPAFGLFAALPDGTVVALPQVTNTARLQVIHNSPSPTVDIWVNGTPFLTNFAYRTATSFVDVPAGTTLNIGVAPSPSDSPDDIIATFPVTLAPDQIYIAIATGIVGNATTPFNLLLVEDARESADAGEVDFLVYHGSTDAPAVDVIARGVGTLVDDAAYGDVTDYLTVPAAAYTLDVTPAMNNDQIVASFAADLSGLGGGAAVVFASGFLAPPTAADPAFGLFAALPDGTVVALPQVTNTARLQVIHNSPSPTVDIWVNGEPFLTNFAYRTATPYVDVPAGTTLNIGVAPSPSDSPDDIIATFPVTLAPDQTYIAIATGIVGNATTPFNLVLVEDARESADAGEVDFLVYHGSTDAPAVDVIARGVGTLVDNAAYGDVTDYLTVPAAAYTLDVTPAMDNDQIVASFQADLSGLGGGAAVVFASGFLAPPTAADPAFGLFAALPDGTVVALPQVTNTARLQVIHNSPSPTVDIWVNGTPFLTNFAYRTATSFVDVPAGTTLNIGVAPSPSDSPDDIIATFPVTLAPDQTYIAIATGIVGNATTPFNLLLVEDARESADAGEVDFLVYHGSTDAPAVDVIARGVGTLVDNAAYGDVTDYLTVPAAAYTLDVTPAMDNDQIVASFQADLSGLGGGAAVVFASGFLAPPTAADPAFGLFAALPDGTVVALPQVTNTARLQVIHNSPSPTVDIWVNGTPFLTNFAYRTATSFVDVPAGATLNIGVAPSPSDSPDDIIATFPVTLAPDQTYIAIATGIVGNATTPFNLLLVEDARESADAGEVDFLVYHGSTDAPAVDVIARGVGTLVDNAAYGDVTDYLTVPAASYTLDVTPAMNNDQIVASFAADLSGLGGGAAVVFASGFLNPPMSSDPAFGLWVALPDGTTFPLELVLSIRDQAPEVSALNIYPNPTTEFVTVDIDLKEATSIRLELFDVTGRLLRVIQHAQPVGDKVVENIAVADQPAGTYLLVIRTDKGTSVQRLLIH